MKDLDCLRQIEEELGIKLNELDSMHWNTCGYVMNLSKQVTSLSLYGCKIYNIGRIIKPLQYLTCLSELNISRNYIKKINPISNLGNLSSLYASGNKIIDITPISYIGNLTTLNITNNEVRDLSSLRGMSCLKYLYFSRNKINCIKFLSGFQNLLRLGFFENMVDDLEPLATLQNLLEVDMSNNHVTALDPLSDLKSVVKINASKNKVRSLDALSSLSNLTTLSISHNYINNIEPISSLHKLSFLNLSSNYVQDLQPISSLKNLVGLSLSDNLIVDISPISKLVNLKELDLSKNQIVNLPHWITDLSMEMQWSETIENGYMTFFNNPLKTPPPEIVIKGNAAVTNYFKQLKEMDKDYLFEAKLLIVGEAGAGKTTLARKLEDHDCPLPDDDDTTRGINVKPNFFVVREEDYPEINGKNLDVKTFRMNIWDFGGQEIYKPTHRFFLSNRSLYVLVVDNRKENADFNYWLHIIEMFGGNSPVLILSNEKQQRQRDIDVSALRQRFENIRDILTVDFAESDHKRLCDLDIAIRHQIKRLPHIGSPVPATWTIVRKRLDEEQQHTISLQEYIALCKAEKITERKDALMLSQYFHDIGVFLHFQDDPLLNKTIFLKQNFATLAVYKLLDHPLLDSQHGRFSREDAATIWHEEEYADLRDELLRLMQNFFLSYEINASGNYIVPEKLPSASPEYPWISTGNLYLQYAYDLFMPKGIMSQFIVEMHRYISNHDLVWKRGCLLERDGAFAEVIESYDAWQIAIRLSGKNKRDFMTIIAEKLDAINLQYEKMKVDKLIPCNCQDCTVSEKPFFYKYADLKRRIEKGKQDVECGNSFEMLNVRQLIDDVLNEDFMPNDDMRGKARIFVSYSHQDTEYLAQLKRHLKASQNMGLAIDVWDDTRIRSGNDWKKEIEKALASATIGIILVSIDFLASDFIMNDELPSLLKSAENNGLKILPLIIKPCGYQGTPLSKFQAQNDPNRTLSELSEPQQERCYMNLMGRIKELLNEGGGTFRTT